jgi:hypothetical protein
MNPHDSATPSRSASGKTDDAPVKKLSIFLKNLLAFSE